MPVARTCALGLATAALVMLMQQSVSAQQRDKGWWVVVGSFPTEPPARMTGDYERTNAAVARCGFRTFNDFSDKFRGFQPGYNVFVIGAYPSRAGAERVASKVRGCAPGAYVRYGEYLGE
jgi:hypothetical protein